MRGKLKFENEECLISNASLIIKISMKSIDKYSFWLKQQCV